MGRPAGSQGLGLLSRTSVWAAPQLINSVFPLILSKYGIFPVPSHHLMDIFRDWRGGDSREDGGDHLSQGLIQRRPSLPAPALEIWTRGLVTQVLHTEADYTPPRIPFSAQGSHTDGVLAHGTTLTQAPHPPAECSHWRCQGYPVGPHQFLGAQAGTPAVGTHTPSSLRGALLFLPPVRLGAPRGPAGPRPALNLPSSSGRVSSSPCGLSADRTHSPLPDHRAISRVTGAGQRTTDSSLGRLCPLWKQFSYCRGNNQYVLQPKAMLLASRVRKCRVSLDPYSLELDGRERRTTGQVALFLPTLSQVLGFPCHST